MLSESDCFNTIEATCEAGVSLKYAIKLTDAAKEALRGMGRDARRNIGHRINLLADGLQGDFKKLDGARNLHRLRVGNFRVIFRLECATITVF